MGLENPTEAGESPDTGYPGPLRFLDAVTAHRWVESQRTAVLATMLCVVRRANRKGLTPAVGMRQLAQDSGLSKSTVAASIHAARGAGFLRSVASGQRHTNLYELRVPGMPLRPECSEEEISIAAPADDAGFDRPDIDPNLPDFDWATNIANDCRLFRVMDGARSVRKQVLYFLGKGMSRDAVIAAFKANGAAGQLHKSWEILEEAATKVDDEERRRRDAEVREWLQQGREP